MATYKPMKEYKQAVAQAVELLNDILEHNPRVIRHLIEEPSMRVTDEWVVNHPHIQVKEATDGRRQLNPLGLINGLFGSDDNGAILAVYDKESGRRIVRFEAGVEDDKGNRMLGWLIGKIDDTSDEAPVEDHKGDEGDTDGREDSPEEGEGDD